MHKTSRWKPSYVNFLLQVFLCFFTNILKDHEPIQAFNIFNSLLNVIIIIAKINFFLLITIYLSHYVVLLYYI